MHMKNPPKPKSRPKLTKGKQNYLSCVRSSLGGGILSQSEKDYVEKARQLGQPVRLLAKEIKAQRRRVVKAAREAARLEARRDKFMPGNVPKFVRCYDNSETDDPSLDCYTAVFSGKYRDNKTGGMFIYISMNARPFHAQGIGQHGESHTQIDTHDGWPPAMGKKCHLGRRVPFQQLPRDCRRLIMHDYLYFWDLVPEAHDAEIDYSVVDKFITDDEEADAKKSQ